MIFRIPGSCNVTLALTSEACFKGLPKNTAGEVVQFKGWPKLNWFITEHLARPPKDWNPPPRLTDDTPAYVEYTTQQVSHQPALQYLRF